jgi:hypothetical protein
MTTIIIQGQPLASFEYDYIPSWNEVISWANQRPKRAYTRQQQLAIYSSRKNQWKHEGQEIAESFMGQYHPYRDYLIECRAFVLLKVIRLDERSYDVHNVWLKAIFDGFTNANIWPDDEWPNVPTVMATWWPNVDNYVAHTFIIEIHELEAFTYNGLSVGLPAGRHRDGRGDVLGRETPETTTSCGVDKAGRFEVQSLPLRFRPNSQASLALPGQLGLPDGRGGKVMPDVPHDEVDAAFGV